MENLFLYLTGYILLLLGISFWLSKKNTDEDFLIAGRNRKTFQIMSSKFATSVGVAWFITYTGYAYLYGFSVLGILPGLLISYLLFAYWAVPKIYKDSKKEKFYTQGDFVLSKTNNTFDKKLIDWFGILMTLIWLLIAFIGGAKVISFLGIFSYGEALIITSIVVLIYILLSGYRAVIITDIIQTIIVLGLFGIIIFSLFQTKNISAMLFTNTSIIDITTLIGLFIYGVFANFSLPDRYQITFSAKSEEQAKKGMAFAVIPIILTVLFLLVIGIYVHSLNPNLDPDLVFIKLFFEYLPETFISIGALLFLAGLMSTADTNIYNIASYLAFLKKKNGNKVKQIRILTIGLIILITIIAYYVRDIIGATILGAGFTVVPSIAMIYIISGGKNSRRFFALILGGLIGLVMGIILFGITPTIAIFPIIFALFGFLIGSKIFRKKQGVLKNEIHP